MKAHIASRMMAAIAARRRSAPFTSSGGWRLAAAAAPAHLLLLGSRRLGCGRLLTLPANSRGCWEGRQGPGPPPMHWQPEHAAGAHRFCGCGGAALTPFLTSLVRAIAAPACEPRAPARCATDRSRHASRLPGPWMTAMRAASVRWRACCPHACPCRCLHGAQCRSEPRACSRQRLGASSISRLLA